MACYPCLFVMCILYKVYILCILCYFIGFTFQMSVVAGVECCTADKRLHYFIHACIWKCSITWNEIWSFNFEGEMQSFSFCYSQSDFGAGIVEDRCCILFHCYSHFAARIYAFPSTRVLKSYISIPTHAKTCVWQLAWNLHPSKDLNDIKQAIMEKGHEVTNIWNAKRRSTNRPLPLHFLHIKPHPTNKEIYHITTLLHTMVTVEAPHVKRAIPQCMRCQKYGHTKNYCRNSTKCVKCAEQHLTSECPRKFQDTAVKCTNCGD